MDGQKMKSSRVKLMLKWPLKSNLNPNIYSDPVSLIPKELIEQEVEEITTLEEVNETKYQGWNTETLAIELTQPPRNDEPQWRQVYTPRNCFWPLAKAHVLAHDSAYHELVAHGLRSHCSTKPYIIAANRQLNTLEINALARKGHINAGGIIETTFSAKKYSMELSSAAYDKLWRFDMESLPADLIRRGMAFEDPNAKHGLQLTITDYPYAKDGLDLWFIIKKWVTNYVSHYYPTAGMVDREVCTWGHEDKKDEPWWPVLKNQENLVQVMTTIIWVASAHHAAANFGQYMYGGVLS
ncbi:Lipoxygenase, C-terminal [Dillenia turbinata]|uniref:Lipoxygenase, C-terminal n=1 Tax=Dillenia turbinata TaxID=194707 RepID=A0AAN8VHL0_9MAGN